MSLFPPSSHRLLIGLVAVALIAGTGILLQSIPQNAAVISSGTASVSSADDERSAGLFMKYLLLFTKLRQEMESGESTDTAAPAIHEASPVSPSFSTTSGNTQECPTDTMCSVSNGNSVQNFACSSGKMPTPTTYICGGAGVCYSCTDIPNFSTFTAFQEESSAGGASSAGNSSQASSTEGEAASEASNGNEASAASAGSAWSTESSEASQGGESSPDNTYHTPDAADGLPFTFISPVTMEYSLVRASNDGRHFATFTWDGTLIHFDRLLNQVSKIPLNQKVGMNGGNIAITADGKTIAISVYRDENSTQIPSIMLYNTQTKATSSIPGTAMMALSPSGRFVVGAKSVYVNQKGMELVWIVLDRTTNVERTIPAAFVRRTGERSTRIVAINDAQEVFLQFRMYDGTTQYALYDSLTSAVTMLAEDTAEQRVSPSNFTYNRNLNVFVFNVRLPQTGGDGKALTVPYILDRRTGGEMLPLLPETPYLSMIASSMSEDGSKVILAGNYYARGPSASGYSYNGTNAWVYDRTNGTFTDIVGNKDLQHRFSYDGALHMSPDGTAVFGLEEFSGIDKEYIGPEYKEKYMLFEARF